MPTVLLARPRTQPVARSRHAKLHAVAATHTQPKRSSRKERAAIAAAPSRHKLQEAKYQPNSRHRRHEVERAPVKQSRVRSKVQPAREIAVAEPKPVIPAPLVIKAKVAPENQETGVSHPPDFDDANPATPEPAVSVMPRPAQRPQLPPVEEEAATTEILPSLYNKRGRLIMPPPLKGSHEILLHQNEVAERDGLERVQNDADLERMRRAGMLVALPVNAGLQVDDRLPYNRRYSRPWTAQFLATMARAHYARFHTPLQINSAVRTVEFQERLIRVNGNAAPAQGETASPHLTGQAVDLAKHGLSLSEIAWMRGYLLPLVQEGKIDVEEEFQQACFHISVYRRYIPPTSVPRRSIAATHHDSAAELAVAIR